MWVLNSLRLKTVAGSEFQSLEVIGIKELAKALVRFLSNLTAKGCCSAQYRLRSLTYSTISFIPLRFLSSSL